MPYIKSILIKFIQKRNMIIRVFSVWSFAAPKPVFRAKFAGFRLKT